MEKNACGVDRLARLVGGLALALVALFVLGSDDRESAVTPGQLLVAYAGAELFVTGLTQWCPMSFLLGIDTCESGG